MSSCHGRLFFRWCSHLWGFSTRSHLVLRPFAPFFAVQPRVTGNVVASVEVQPPEWCSHSTCRLFSGRVHHLLCHATSSLWTASPEACLQYTTTGLLHVQPACPVQPNLVCRLKIRRLREMNWTHLPRESIFCCGVRTFRSSARIRTKPGPSMSGNGLTACPVYGKSRPKSCIGSTHWKKIRYSSTAGSA